MSRGLREERNFNPRSPHGERLVLPETRQAASRISIHAPRTGSDGRASPSAARYNTISIHAPRTGSDGLPDAAKGRKRPRFQSTLPARGATTDGDAQAPPRKISIHAPRTGSDDHQAAAQCIPHISIHAPRTGSDSISTPSASYLINFNPRSPHGERLSRSAMAKSNSDFNPRAPHGERLWRFRAVFFQCPFNPRSPHGERLIQLSIVGVTSYFNPRSPHGERRGTVRNYLICGHFNPRSPHGERRFRGGAHLTAWGISIHAPRTGSDLASAIRGMEIATFQSTLPARGATDDGKP